MPSSAENCEESKRVLVKAIIDDFTKKCVLSNVDHKEIKKALDEIYCTELLLSKEIYEWALEKIVLIPQPSSKPSNSPEGEQEAEEPLFCEDTVYHASLCCLAVSTRDTNNFKSFFDREYTCHHFEEASLSISQDRKNVDRYLIAQKEKTIFVAFQSEASFSKWPQLFNSFEHGEY